jgi:hypothetical protein
VWAMKKFYVESRKRGISYIVITGINANAVGHMLLWNYLLKHVVKGIID